MSTQLLLIDRSTDNRDGIRSQLLPGWALEWVSVGNAALYMLHEVNPDIIVLDLDLPDVDGLVLLPILRRRTSVPIIVTTWRNSRERVLALKLGADALVTVPFDSLELVSVIEAVMRRSSRLTAALPPDVTFKYGPLSLSSHNGALLNDQPLKLTHSQFMILLTLAYARGQVVSHAVLAHILNEQPRPLPTTRHLIEQHVLKLRKILGADQPSPSIVSVRGKGYKLTC